LKTDRRLADMLYHYHFLVAEEGWTSPAFMQEIKSAGYLSPDQDGIVLAILEHLPEGSYVESIDDLREILQEHYGATDYWAISHDAAEQEKIQMEADFHRLVAPARYDFEAPIFGSFNRYEGDPVPVDLAIGGRHDLRFLQRRIEEVPEPLRPGWRRVGPEEFKYVPFLSGQIEAVHWTGALRRVLVLCEEVTGTHLAMDLAQCSSVTSQHRRYMRVAAERLFVSLSREADGWAKSINLSPQQANALSQTDAFWPESPSPYLDRLFREAEQTHEDSDLSARRGYALAPFSLGAPDARRLRTAARFLTKAMRAESPADSYLFMGTCLEALLVSGEEAIGERLRDAVALILGRTFEERVELKNRVKKLYGTRSRYVHGGQYDRNERERVLCLDIAKRVLAAELKLLRDAKE
jgi:hypothetical protein